MATKNADPKPGSKEKTATQVKEKNIQPSG